MSSPIVVLVWFIGIPFRLPGVFGGHGIKEEIHTDGLIQENIVCRLCRAIIIGNPMCFWVINSLQLI